MIVLALIAGEVEGICRCYVHGEVSLLAPTNNEKQSPLPLLLIVQMPPSRMNTWNDQTPVISEGLVECSAPVDLDLEGLPVSTKN